MYKFQEFQINLLKIKLKLITVTGIIVASAI